MPDPITLADKRPDQCQRCGTLGADSNPAGLEVTRWRCGRCSSTWTTDEIETPSITLVDVRAHIERRIRQYAEDSYRYERNIELRAQANELHKEFTEVLAMLDRVQSGGAR